MQLQRLRIVVTINIVNTNNIKIKSQKNVYGAT